MEGRVKESVVVAFGGNAMLPRGRGTTEEQRRNIAMVCRSLAEVASRGHTLLVTHGNGPQVGEILLQSEVGGAEGALPLDVAGAMSQGQIGYLLQQELSNALLDRGCARPVCSVLTQVVVDPSDPAFDRPTKPIGRYYQRAEVQKVSSAQLWTLKPDSGRGFRRVVASPEPQCIVEWECIRTLLDADMVVIAAGGGGIPVTRDGERGLRGVEAVIDKDLAAWRLATLLGADTLVFLTAVDAVLLEFGTPFERPLEQARAAELERRLETGEFPEGSMGPKIRASVRFLRDGGKRAIITSPAKLGEAIDGRAGTWVLPDATTPATPVHRSS
jgi:carbamate kinase